MGGGLHLLLDLVGHCLRSLRHRCFQSSYRRLEGREIDDRSTCHRRPQYGGVDETSFLPSESHVPHRARSQYTSISYTDRLGDFNIDASIGTVGDSYDNAMAESMFAIVKTELFRNPAVLTHYGGHWKGLDDIEIATCA